MVTAKACRPVPPFLPAVALAVVVLVLFAVSLESQFTYDARMEILTWDFIHTPRNLVPVLTFRVMGMDVLDFNRPMQLASLMIDSLFWGKNPFGYFLTDILLHLTATILVFFLVRHLLRWRNAAGGGESWRDVSAFLAAALFAVHPLVTEAVCEPSNRKDLLAAVFGFGSLLVAMGHSSASGRAGWGRAILCSALALLSVASKEVGVAIPPALFLYWLLFRRKEPMKFWIAAIGGSAALAIAFLIARFSLANPHSEIFIKAPAYMGGSLAAAISTQPRILALYLVNIVWPADLCADYSYYSLRNLELTLALPLLLVVVFALSCWSWNDRRVLFGSGLIVFALLPVCNLVPIYCPAADRYLYIPLAGVAVMIGAALDGRWLAAKPRRRWVAAGLVVIIGGILAALTMQREEVWSTPIGLWQDTLERDPQSFAARMNLPDSLWRAGRLVEARAEYEATLKTPYNSFGLAWAGYAVVLNDLGDRTAAAAAAAHGLQLKPEMADGDRMIRTLQAEPDLAEKFARLAAEIKEGDSKPETKKR